MSLNISPNTFLIETRNRIQEAKQKIQSLQQSLSIFNLQTKVLSEQDSIKRGIADRNRLSRSGFFTGSDFGRESKMQLDQSIIQLKQNVSENIDALKQLGADIPSGAFDPFRRRREQKSFESQIETLQSHLKNLTANERLLSIEVSQSQPQPQQQQQQSQPLRPLITPSDQGFNISTRPLPVFKDPRTEQERLRKIVQQQNETNEILSVTGQQTQLQTQAQQQSQISTKDIAIIAGIAALAGGIL